MVDLLIKNANYVVTVDSERRVIRDGAVAIEGMRIADVGKSSELERKYPRAETIDAKGKLVMPGLFDSHAHSAQNILNGMIFLPTRPKKRALSWNVMQSLNLLAGHTPDDARASMALKCLKDITSGTVGFCDWGLKIRYGFDGLADVVNKSGLRAVLGKSVMDKPDSGYLANVIPEGLREDKDECIRDTLRAIKKWHGKADGRIKVWFGPSSVGSFSVETYKEIARLVNEYNTGITFHLAEVGEMDAGYMRSEYGMSPVEFMRSVGWVGPNVDFIHCAYLTGIDFKILAETDTNVVHCASGTWDTKVRDMLEMGVNVALGLDAGNCNTGDIFDAMRHEIVIQNRRPKLDLPILYYEKVLEMATINGAKALMWDKETGSIEKGKRADVIIVNLKKPSMTPVIDPIWNTVYQVRGSDVDTTIVNGKILMQNRVVKTLDEEKVIEEAQKKAEEIKDRAGFEVECPWPLI